MRGAAGIMVGSADEPAERAADALADRVVSTVARNAGRINRATPLRPTSELDERPATARRTIGRAPAVGTEGGRLPDALSREIRRSRGKGEPLPTEIRSRVEPALGTDLSDVRLHRDSPTAPQIAARAFTLGNDVHIAPGESLSGDGGLRLISHELAHVAQHRSGNVAHRTLDPDAVLKAVETSEYLKGKLKQSSHIQAREAKPERMRARVAKILRQHEQMFAGEPDADSLALALAIDGIAVVIAGELYDPALKPEIASQLFAVYGPKIEAAVAKKSKSTPAAAAATVGLAKTIVGGDPLSRYMHREMRIEEAALEIDRMATAANRTADQMFDLLARRFQSEMASYTMGEIHDQEHRRSSFELSESTGERSTKYMKKLFGDVANTAQMPKRADTKGLDFSAHGAKQLADLKSAVAKAAAGTLGYTTPTTAADRRSRYLAEVGTADAAIRDERTAALKQVLTSEWKLSSGQADALIARLKAPNGLRGLPLTVTHWGGRRTADQKDGSAFSTKDVSRAGQTTSQASRDVIGKKHTKAQQALPTETLQSVGRYDDPVFGEQRGERYTQFRKWKDRLMTGNYGFADDELPVFGAANIFFEQTKGTGSYQRPDAIQTLGNKTKRTAEEDQLLTALTVEAARVDGLADDQKVGLNYYGDMHLKLNYNRVKDRIIYTAGDHGQPHRDPFLAFVDFAVGSTATYESSITQLRETKVPNNAKAIVSAILDPKNAWVMDLPFEIQIHGGVDWETDVDEIWVSPSMPSDAKKRLVDWVAKDSGKRPPIKVVAPDKGVTVQEKWNNAASRSFAAALAAIPGAPLAAVPTGSSGSG